MKVLFLLLFSAAFLVLLVLSASAVSTLLSEAVSTSSDYDARFPAVAVGPSDVYLIHVAWEDDTEMNASTGGLPIKDGPDKDVFYIFKNRTDWSSLHSEEGQLKGGLQLVSDNTSITNNQNPDIVVDYNNIIHVIWQGLTKPPELEADANTTFLLHFEDANLNAEYAEGQAEPVIAETTSSSNSIYSQSVYMSGDDKLSYDATNNINISKGTIEFWYNRQRWSRDNSINVLFEAINETMRNDATSTYHTLMIALTSSSRTTLRVSLVYNSTINFTLNYTPSYEVKNNEWHHIAFTYNFKAGDCRLYFDGYLAIVNTTCYGIPFSPSNITVGADETNYENSLYRANGLIDELRLSDNVRSADEIRGDAGQFDIYHRSLSGTTWSAITAITSNDDNNSYFPSVGVDKNNTLRMVWNSYHNSSFSTVKYRQRGWTNPVWANSEDVSSGTLNYFPDIAVDDYNNSYVVWQNVDASTGNFSGFSTIVYRQRNQSYWASAQNVSNRTYEIYGVNTTRGYTQFIFSTPRIAAGAGNTTHVAWATQSGFPDQDLLFYLSFDNMDANVTFANGSTLAGQNTSYSASGRRENATTDTFTPINTGHALLINGSGYANYSASGNFNYEYGTIMMWVKPDWVIGSKEPEALNVIFGYYSANATLTDINEFIMLYFIQCDGTETTCTDLTSSLLTFGIYDNTSSMKSGVYNATGWHDWYHVAVTWNLTGGTRETKMYVDGSIVDFVLNDNDTTPLYFNDTPTEIIVGNLFSGSSNGYIYTFNGSVDEVMVFGRILAESEIAAAMRRDMDIVYRQKNDSGWQKYELVSTGSNKFSLLPAIAAKDNYAYVAWPFSQGDFNYLSTTYNYGSFYKIAMNTRNVTWKGIEFANDESTREAYAPDVTAVRPARIDAVWEDVTFSGGTYADIIYREFTNTTTSTVQLGYPTGGEVISADFNVNATADDVDSAISNITFYYTMGDGFSGNIICTAASSPYECLWIIGATAEDIYKVKAVATSSDGGRNWSMSNYMYLDSSTAVKMYNFNETGNDIGSNTAYQKGWTKANDAAQRPNISDTSTYPSEVGDDTNVRANLSSSDNQRYKVYLPPVCGKYNYTNAIIFKFYINESPGDISNIAINWEGYGYSKTGYLTNMSLWNFNGAYWQPVAYKEFNEESDSTLSYSLAEGFSDYLDSENNTIYIMVETDDYHSSRCGGGWNLGSFPTGGVVCPLYLSWNGTSYQFETEGILGIFDKYMETPTYDRLNNIKPENGKIRIAIAEVVDETTYMDNAELIAVDHPEDVGVLLDFDGKPHTIKNPKSALCTDRFGNDCTRLVAEEDEKPEGALSSLQNGLVGSRSLYDLPLMNGPEGNYWVSNLSALGLSDPNNLNINNTRDYIELALPEPEDNEKDSEIVKLIISGSDTGLLGQSEAALFGLAGESLPHLFNILDNTFIGKLGGEGLHSTIAVRIHVLDEKNQWVDYPVRFDNAVFGSYRTLLFPLNRSIIRDDKARINTMLYSYAIDYVAVDYSKDEEVSVSTAKPDIKELAESDETRAKFRKGDFVEISFDEPEKKHPSQEEQQMKRSYFLKTEGYYHPGEKEDRNKFGIKEIKTPIDLISELRKVENWTVYAKMIYNPQYAEEYLLDHYLKNSLTNISADSFGDSKMYTQQIKKTNSLYTDFIRITVSGCIVPVDNLEVWSTTKLCADSHFIVPDADGDGAVIKIMGRDLIFDCAGSILDSGGNSDASLNQQRGAAIGLNHTQNVTVRNCTVLRYGIGMGMNYSRDVRFQNNTLRENYIGMGGENSNNSILSNNTIIWSFYVGLSIIGGSTNNTIADNSIINVTLLGMALDNADSNTMESNTINGTFNLAGKRKSGLGGIGIMRNADMNTIKNNRLYNLGLGVGVADVGSFLGLGTYGYSGQKNNFTSNIMTNISVGGIGLAYPYDVDYYNYFDQNNIVNGERVYYYYDVHGNETNYVQINALNLTAGDISIFAGKITLANCSYINITNSNFSENFYGMLITNSHHILVSGSRAYNNRDSLLSFASTHYPVGSGYAILNSYDINFTGNNASSNRIGYYTTDSYKLTFANNTAWFNSHIGFFINATNISTFRNNSAQLNNLSAFVFQYSGQNNVVNNTAIDNVKDQEGLFGTSGFYFGSSFNNTITNNIAFNNSYGFVLNSTNDTFSNNTAINNSIAGVTFAECLNNSVINVPDNTVGSNTGAGYMFFICNNTRAVNLNTTGNLRAGFEIYGSSSLSLSNLWPREDEIGFLFNQSQNCTLANSYSINATSTGIYFYSSKDNNIVDSFLINNVSSTDIYSETDSWNNNFLNCSLGTSAISDDNLNSNNSNISIQWYLDMYIQDNESIPVGEASVWLNDTLGNTYSTIGNSYAKARVNLTEYVLMSGVQTYFSNYTWNVTKIGYMSNVSMVNMSENKDINVTINLLGGIADTSPPTAPVVYDGYDYVDYDWTNNASVLFSSWSNSTDRHLIFYGYRVLENGTCIAGKCAPTEVGQLTQTMITGLTLREGYNYSVGVRARDSLYYYSPFIYSDGIIADLTPPNATINSTTHPNSSQWYSTQNVTFTFYGNDSLSGIAGYSHVLDENSGTGPDLIEEPAGETVLQSMPSHYYETTLRANSTGHAFAVFSEIKSNLSTGDNVTISVALSEDVSDTLDTMVVKAYLIPTTISITGYDMEAYAMTEKEKTAIDLNHKNAIDADSYSFDLRVNPGASGYFYAVITADIADDNNTHNISVMGRNTNVDNTTSSFICEEEGSCTNTTLTADYAIEATKKEGSITRTKSYTGLANGEHWFHVRAKDVAGNWGNPEHFKVMIDAVNGTPILNTVKPVGYIATSEPTLVVDTNEYTTCYYNTTNLSYSEMTSYDGLHHEKKLSGLAEGTYVYSFNCTDRAGNTIYNDTTFIVDMDAAPDTVSIFAPGNYTVGKTVNIDVNVTKVYNSVSYGLGELAGYFAVNLTNSTSDIYKISAHVTDKGNGIYTVSFTAPLTSGEYTLTVSVKGISNTPERKIYFSTHSLTIRYSSTGMTSVNTKTRMAYSIVGSSYIIGVAGDAAGATSSGSTTSQLQIAGQAINDNLYLFITRSNSNPTSVINEINGQNFMGMNNPSFGYPVNQDEHVVSAMLEYNDVSIEGVNKVQSGRYTLLIKNEGINQTTGKTRVSVSII